MKKSFLFVLIAVFLAISGWTQEIIVVGEGSTTTSELPLNPLYNNSISQSLYLQEEIGTTGTITSLAYHCSKARTRKVEVYMATSSMTSLSPSTSLDYSEMTLVYSDSVSFVENDWTTISLTTPFDYAGDNLIIAIKSENTDYVSGSVYWKCDTVSNRSISRYVDAYVPDFSECYLRKYLPQIKLGITSSIITCAKISGNVTVSSITTDGATISWVDTAENSSYQLQYKTDKQSWDDISDTIDVTNTYYDLTSLMHSQKYAVRVRRWCSDSDFSLWKSATFITECGIANVTDDNSYFEDFSVSYTIDCWTFENAGGTNWQMLNGRLYHSPASGSSADAITPVIDLTGVTTPWLKFSHKQSGYGENSHNNLSIYYRVNESSDWTFITTYDTRIENFRMDSVALPEPSATYQISFRWSNPNSEAYGSHIDSVLVYNEQNPPLCLPASNVIIDSVTKNSAVISWTQTDDANTWKVYYKKATSETYSSSEELYDTSYVLSLEPGNVYKVYVQTICSTDEALNPKTEPKSLTTECDILTSASLPYFTSFEEFEVGMGKTPICWTKLSTGYQSSYYPYVYEYTTANSGKNTLTFCYDNSSIALPGYSGNINELQLDFYARPVYNSYSYGTMEVGIMTNLNDDSTYTKIQTFQAMSWTDTKYKNLTVNFDQYQTTDSIDTYYVVIKHKEPSAYGGYSWFIDDLSLGLVPNCDKVMQANAIPDVNQATITVVGNDTNSYEIYYRKKGEDNWSTPIAFNDSTVTITGLTSASNYEYRIKTICGENSPISAIFTFQTKCDVTSVTNENAWTETLSTNDALQCWELENVGNENWYIATSYGSLCHSLSYGTTADAISPILDLTNVTTPYIKFSHKQPLVSGKNNHLTILYRTSLDNPWKVLAEYTNPVPTQQTDSVALPEPSATYQLNFRWSNPFSADSYIPGIYIYNVTVYNEQNPPACPPLAALTIPNITSSDANIEWTNIPNVSDYTVYYKKNSDDEYQSFNTNANSIAFSDKNINLEKNTTYEVYVSYTCSTTNDIVISANKSFTTNNTSVNGDNYVQTFEGEDEITDFVFIGTSTENKWNIGSATSSKGSMSMYVSNDNGQTNNYTKGVQQKSYAVLSVDFNDKAEYSLNFDYKLAGEASSSGNTMYDYLVVYIAPQNIQLPTTSDNSLLQGATVLLPKTWGKETWTNANIILPNVQNTTQKIIFEWRNDFSGGSDPAAAIDNIKILGSNCASPSNVVVSNVTNSSVDVAWTQQDETSSWTVQYKKQGQDSLWMDKTVSGEASTTIDDLEDNTNYELRVLAVCDDESPSSTSTYFKTSCSAMTITNDTIIDETFAEFPDCWNVLYSYTNEINNSGYLALGTNMSTNNATSILTLPMVTNDLHNLRLIISSSTNANPNEYGSYYPDETLEIGIMTVNDDTSSFVSLKTIAHDDVTGGSWVNITTDFDNLTDSITTGQITLRFRVNNDAGNNLTYLSNYWFIDNIKLVLKPDCFAPTKIVCKPTGKNTIDVSWGEYTGSNNVIAYYKAADTDQWSSKTASTNDTSLTLNNLSTGTKYEIYLTTECPNGTAEESDHFFVTTWCNEISVTDNPYVLEFASYQTGDIPNCWTQLYGHSYSSGTTPCILIDEDDGSGSILFRSPTVGETQYLVLPKFVENINTLRVQINYSSNKSPVFNVGYMTSLYDTSTFVIVKTINVANAEGIDYKIDFNAITDTNGYFALSYTSTNSYAYSVINSLLVRTIPGCLAPTKVTATVNNNGSIDVSWQDNSSATSWKVYYEKTEGNDTVWQSLSTTQKSVTITTGIESSTKYSIYVIADAGCTDAEQSDIVVVSTSCPTIIVNDSSAWEETFSDASALQCWTKSNNWNLSGDKLYHPYSDDDDGKAITPIFNLSAVSSPMLAFTYTLDDYQYSGIVNTLTVSYRATTTDEWTPLKYYSGNPVSDEVDTIVLPNKSANYQLNFQWSDYNIDADGIYIDNIKIFNDPNGTITPDPCGAPTNLVVTAKTQTTATITWNGNATSYEIQLGDNAAETVATTTKTFTNLTANTSYVAKVRAKCDSNQFSEWVTVNFTTDTNSSTSCEQPTNLTVSGVTQTTAT
ncbi:MAG: fibronectin type III domain-containing protein, partial [Bacteroidales bacterium]